MAKAPKRAFVCNECGADYPRWQGQCSACHAWNTITEVRGVAASPSVARNERLSGYAGNAGVSKVQKLSDISLEALPRFSTGFKEFDRVLGGGAVRGSLVLVGGAPGIGKSTLLLQVCANLCKTGKRVLYVSGEESAKQLKLRANRLGITSETLYVLAENALDNVEEKLRGLSPDVAVIDSIQTMYRPDMASAPGSVSQIRECTSQIMRLCKESGTAIFLVGHVTKDGAIAGPRMLEHMVDVVLYFEGDRQQEYRLLRAVKNRFGSVNELGVFQMTEAGMQIVPNPSEQLLSHRAKGASGSVVFCGLEGSRPLLCDVQALASTSYFGTPRRTVGGADTGRVALLLAVLVGFSVLIPYIGAFVVTIPVVGVALFQFGLGTEFWSCFAVYLIIQGLDGNLLVPVLFSEAVNLHPLVIILSVVIFGGLWGFWGVFFAIPLATLIKAVVHAWPDVPAVEEK